jgi:signal transduction histidine kinase/streptogramin lyase
MKTLLTALTALLLLQICLAQNNASTLHFNLLSIKDGMPEGTVRNLLQDKEGYIWIATNIGLVRYDGYAPKVYDFGIKDPNQLLVFKSFEDSRGQLWVGARNALYKYDRANDRFNTYPLTKKVNCFSFTEDKSGNLWLITGNIKNADNSLILLDPANKKEVSFGITEKGKHHVNATSFTDVFKDKQQRIWASSNNGLYEYNAKDSTFIPHLAAADPSKQTSVKYVQEDAAQPGVFYFHTYNIYPYKAGGLACYNVNTGSFTTFQHKAKDENSIGSDTVWQAQNDSKGRLWVLTAAGLSLFNPANGTFTNYADEAFKSNTTWPWSFNIRVDKEGNLWCTSDRGLLLFNVKAKQFIHYTADSMLKNGLASNHVQNPLIDRSGIIWFGADQEGLQWLDTKQHRFVRYANDNAADHLFSGGPANSFAKANDGSIWLGTEHGLYRWLSQQDSIQFIKFAQSANDNTKVRHVIADSKGFIWFTINNAVTGNNDVLYCYNPATRKMISYQHRQNDSTSLISNFITYLYEDRSGDIWTGTDGGICHFNRHYQTFTRFPFIKNDGTISEANGALDDAKVRYIHEDKEGILWVGTNLGGLNRFNPQQGTFTSYVGKMPGCRCVVNINEDNKGRLWVGTYLEGLFELNKSRDSIKQFTEKDGLLYDGVIATAEDNTGNIWVTSRRGISILNPATGQVRTITDVDNLSLNRYAIPKTSNGDFLISTNSGFISLNPDDFAPDTYAPVVHIEALHLTELVNNKPKDSVVVAGTGKSYGFKYNENRISFHYVGLYYQDAANTQYAYKLDGYDKDWIPAGTQRTVTYTNLAPRTYTFYVKAANSDGVWSKEESITFTITPPWWKTWWAYLLYALLIAGAIRGYIVYRSRALRQENRILEQKVAQRTQEVELQKEEIEAQRDNLEETLSELKAAQAQLIQSEKMASLGQLTAGIAHEIQNPLNFVNNFSEINTELIVELKEEIEKGDLEEVKAIANDIEENEQKIIHHGKRAGSIVKGMLEHSRASTGKKEMTDINALVDECVRLSYHGLRAKDKEFNAGIKTDFDESIGKINVVPQDISRVLLNLFNNALYAVDEKKRQLNGMYEPAVSVCTKKLDGKVEIQVKDNGNGIPQNIISKIFQPFFTTKPTGQGTGLGLSLSYDIIKAHSAEIKVESKEGEGTAFMITLPKNN